MKVYHAVIVNAYAKDCGTMMEPDGWEMPKSVEEAIERIDSGERWTLVNGKYPDYDLGSLRFHGRLVSEGLKNILEQFDSANKVSFIPIMATSEEYGERPYYIAIIKEEHGIIDLESSKVLETGAVTVPVFYYEKVKDLNIFSTRPVAYYDIVVSSKVKTAMRKAGVTFGVSFGSFYAH